MSHKRQLGQTLCFASLRLLLLLRLGTVRIDTRSAIKYATIILLRSACCSDCCCCCSRGEEGEGGRIPTKCGHFNNEKHQLFMHSTPTVVVVVVAVRCLVSILLVRCFVVVLFYDSHCCSSAVSTLLPLCFTPCTPCPLLLFLLLVAAAKLFQYTRVLFVFYPPNPLPACLSPFACFVSLSLFVFPCLLLCVYVRVFALTS